MPSWGWCEGSGWRRLGGKHAVVALLAQPANRQLPPAAPPGAQVGRTPTSTPTAAAHLEVGVLELHPVERQRVGGLLGAAQLQKRVALVVRDLAAADRLRVVDGGARADHQAREEVVELLLVGCRGGWVRGWGVGVGG